VAGSIFLFFFFSAEKVAGESGGCQRLFTGGGRRAAVVAASGWLWLVDQLMGCFGFILNLCNFFKMLRC
jgi:hypothetical protein